MAKFFRKIRSKLLQEHETGKYLKYAFGEIVLIVIGILIALQLNAWNQAKQNRVLELRYLNGIENDLLGDIRELETLFERDTLKFDAYTAIIKTLGSSDYAENKQKIAVGLRNISGLRWFEGQNAVFEELKSSGKLNLVQSDSIRYAIQRYYRFFVEVVKQEQMNNDRSIVYRDRYAQVLDMYPLLESTFNQRWNGNLGAVDLSFMDSPEFGANRLVLVENISQIKGWEINSHYVRLRLYDMARELKISIHSYLENNK